MIVCLLLGGLSTLPAQVDSTTDKQEANATATKPNTTPTDDGTQSLEEALDNKPGINFSSVQIGGQSSGINLSSIRADSVESLEALKLATPDMDADIVGGTLNLKFRPAFAQSKPTRQLRAYLTYYELSGKVGPSLYITEGQAFGTEHRWGYLLNGRTYMSYLAEENLNRDWQVRRNSEWPDVYRFQDVQIEKESFRSDSVSANILVDYEFTKELRIFSRAIVTDINRDEINRHLGYEWDDGTFTALDQDSATVEGMTLFKGIEERRNERRTREITLGTQYKGTDWRWEAQVKYDYSNSEYPLRWDSFFSLKDIDASYENASGEYPVFTIHGDSRTRVDNPDLYEFEEVRIVTSQDLYIDEIASLDVERFFTPTKGKLKIKSGLKFLNRDLDSGDDINVYDGASENLTIGQFESSWRNDDILFGNYSLAGFHDPVAFREFFLANPDIFEFNETRTRSQTDPANYTVNEVITSAYVMGDYNLNKWRILAGVRIEETEDEFTGKEVTFDTTGAYKQTIDTEGTRSYSNLFPGIQAVYSPTKKLTLYTSWSKALERPRYNYLAPFRRIIQRSQVISAGNSNLQPTVFTSLLAAADWAYDDSGFLSLELLKRDNEDIVVQSQTTITEGQFTGFELYTWENVANGLQNQIQVVWNQDLDPLWYELDGFSFEMRYRYNDTETDVRGPEFPKLPIALVPENDIRASLIFQNQSWLVRLRADHDSELLRSVGSNPERDTYSLGRTSYSFSVEYRTIGGWTGNIGVYNLTQDEPEQYFGDQLRPTDIAARGRYWRTTLRYTF